MIVLGVDPSTVATGWGILEGDKRRSRAVASGVLRPPTRAPLPERLHAIHTGIGEICERQAPDVLVIESTFLHRNVKTALALGQARGVILLAAVQREIEIVEYSALEIKRAAVGYGAADKEQVAHMMRRVLGLAHRPTPDEADALAAAWCHLSRCGSPGALRGVR